MKSLKNKKCTGCKKILSVNAFRKDKQKPTGLTSKCKKCRAFDRRSFYKKNKRSELERNKIWWKKNKDYHRKLMRDHFKNNKEYYKAKNAKRRAIKVSATPPWADLEGILFFYIFCPAGCHVDHIIPLQGDIVTGLHTLENLQYLPASKNLSKGNTYE